MSDKLTPEEMAAAIAKARRITSGQCSRSVRVCEDIAEALVQLADEREVVPLSIEKDGYRVDTVEFSQVVTLHEGNRIIGRTYFNDEKWNAYTGVETPNHFTLPLGRYDTPEAAAEAIWTTWEAEHDE